MSYEERAAFGDPLCFVTVADEPGSVADAPLYTLPQEEFEEKVRRNQIAFTTLYVKLKTGEVRPVDAAVDPCASFAVQSAELAEAMALKK